jgi:hypothetical protein
MDERAVVDRIEDGDLAVVLVGDDEVEHIVPRDELPEGTEAGTVLRVSVEDGRIVNPQLDEEDTEATEKRVGDKMRKLRERGRKL